MKKTLLLLSTLGLITATNCFAEPTSFSDEANVKKTANEKGKKAAEMPNVIISGTILLCADYTAPDVVYYDGENAMTQVKDVSLIQKTATERANKDTSMMRFGAGDTADLVFTVIGKTENNWVYGAKVDLLVMRGETGADKMYGFFERNNIGTLNFGNLRGPECSMLCGGQELIGGASGLNEILPENLDLATGVVGPVNVIGYSSRATKAIYYSPVIHGFQAGVSITPDTKHQGRNSKDWHTGNSGNGNDSGLFNATPTEAPSGRNNMVFALSHSAKLNDDWSTKFTGLYLMENTQPINVNTCINKDIAANGATPAGTALSKIPLRNASAYQMTGTISYRNWSLGCGYLNNGKSRLPKLSAYTNSDRQMIIPGGFITTKDGDAGQAWNVGLKCKLNEKWTVAGVYHNTSRKITATEKARGDIFTVTCDYLICSGLKVFLEIDQAITRSSDTACQLHNLFQTKKIAIRKQNSTLISVGAVINF